MLQAKTAVSRGCSIVFIDKCGAHSKHFAAKRPTARPARLHRLGFLGEPTARTFLIVAECRLFVKKGFFLICRTIEETPFEHRQGIAAKRCEQLPKLQSVLPHE